MADLLDLLAPLPSSEDYSVESLLFELGIELDAPELVWE